jgi:hypothetical protein
MPRLPHPPRLDHPNNIWRVEILLTKQLSPTYCCFLPCRNKHSPQHECTQLRQIFFYIPIYEYIQSESRFVCLSLGSGGVFSGVSSEDSLRREHVSLNNNNTSPVARQMWRCPFGQFWGLAAAGTSFLNNNQIQNTGGRRGVKLRYNPNCKRVRLLRAGTHKWSNSTQKSSEK